MLPRALAAVVLAIAVFLPVTSAAPAFWGTEEEPELTDPPGNVQYSPLYTGPQDRDHIDLLAAWFEYDAVNDNLNLTMKVASLEHVNETTEANWDVRYTFRGNITHQEEFVAELRYGVARSSQTGTWSPSVSLDTSDMSGGSAEVPFAFQRDDQTPGYFRWTVPMAYLQNRGDQVTDFVAHAAEEQFVGRSFVSTNVYNDNPANAQGSFDWQDLEPVPINTTYDDFLTPTSGDKSPTSAQSDTVAIGLAASAVAILLAVGLRRRRR